MQHMGLAAPWLVGSSLIRDWTCVCCIGRWILNTGLPGKSWYYFFNMITCVPGVQLAAAFFFFSEKEVLILTKSPMAQLVKNLPAMQETQEIRAGSLGWEDSLEEEMATHSSILAWRIPCTEEPGGPQSVGSHRVGHNRAWAPVVSLEFILLRFILLLLVD